MRQEQEIRHERNKSVTRSVFAAILMMLLNVGLLTIRWNSSEFSCWLLNLSTDLASIFSLGCLAYSAFIGIKSLNPYLYWLEAFLSNEQDYSDKFADRSFRRQTIFLNFGIILFAMSFTLGTIESMLCADKSLQPTQPDSIHITNWPSSLDHLDNKLSNISSAIERLADSCRVSQPPIHTAWPCSTLRIKSDSAETTLKRIAIAVENLGESLRKKRQPDPIIPLNSRDILYFLAIAFFLLAGYVYWRTDTQTKQAKLAAWKFLAKIGTLFSLSASLLAIDNFTLSIGDINICTGQKTEETRTVAPFIEFTKIGTIDSFSTANSIVPDLDTLNSIAMALMDSNWKLLTIRLIGRADKRELNGQIEKYFESNLNLGRQRAIAVRDALLDRCKQNYPPGLNVNLFVIESDGADHVSAPPESLMKRDRAVDVYVVREAKPDILPPHEYRKCECGKHECTKHKH